VAGLTKWLGLLASLGFDKLIQGLADAEMSVCDLHRLPIAEVSLITTIEIRLAQRLQILHEVCCCIYEVYGMLRKGFLEGLLRRLSMLVAGSAGISTG
jgi:hypothetical protein